MESSLNQRYIIDGFNLLHAAILQGRDRQDWWVGANQLRVLELSARFQHPQKGTHLSDRPRLALHIVFDASSPRSERIELPQHLQGSLDLHYAPNADDWIVAEAQRCEHQNIVIVSGDRALQDRAARYGASRMAPWDFAKLCTCPVVRECYS